MKLAAKVRQPNALRKTVMRKPAMDLLSAVSER